MKSESFFHAQRKAQIFCSSLCDHPIDWTEKAVSPEGHSFFQGGHPVIMRFEQKHPTSQLYRTNALDNYDLTNKWISDTIGRAAWWNRWQVEPDYDPVLEPIAGAIHAYPGSHFYIAPFHGQMWQVHNEYRSGDTGIEIHETKVSALEAARHLALGIKTKKQKAVELPRLAFVALFALFAVWLIFR